MPQHGPPLPPSAHGPYPGSQLHGEAPRPSFLVILSNPAFGAEVGAALQTKGADVEVVDRIAALERWPVGRVVVTDAHHLTPFWHSVGATGVLLLAADNTEGAAALMGGATGWVLKSRSASSLAERVFASALFEATLSE